MSLKLEKKARIKLMELHEAMETTSPLAIDRKLLTKWAKLTETILKNSGVENE